MPNYYYVKYDTSDAVDGQGTATGDGGRATSKRTGAWSTTVTEFYQDIETCFTQAALGVGMAEGDYIIVSNLHDYDHLGSTGTYALPVSNITIISVDDANQEQYLAGATESASSSDIISSELAKALIVKGMTFEADDDFNFNGIASNYNFTDTTIHCTGATAGIRQLTFQADGATGVFKNCVFNWDTSRTDIGLFVGNSGSEIVLDGCRSTSSNKMTILGDFQFGNGGSNVIIKDSDLDSILLPNGFIANTLSANSDRVSIDIVRCKLPSNLTPFVTLPTSPIQNWEFNITQSGVADDYHYFMHLNPLGQSEEDLTTVHTSTYDGTNKFSVGIDTTTLATTVAPFIHKALIIPAVDMTAGSGWTIECEVTSEAGLTNNDLWIEVIYADDTDEALSVSSSSQAADVLSGGTALTASSGWTNPLAAQYKITHVIPDVLPTATNANITVLFCVGNGSALTTNWDLPVLVLT